MHHAMRVRVDPTLTELDVRRSSAARFFVFRSQAVANKRVRDTVSLIRAYDRSHDATHPHPNRQSTAYRRVPVRRELARAHRRDGGQCVRLRDRVRRIEATDAWPVEHAAGWADGNGREVGQDEHVG